MRWTHKARLQRWIAALPQRASQYLYYVMQRRFGGLRTPDPWSHLETARGVADRHARHARRTGLHGSTVFEVGTGRSVMLPVGLWLLGAQRVYTYDLNPYLREELVLGDIEEIRKEPNHVFEVLGGSAELERRLRGLLAVPARIHDILGVAGIEYVSPGDARRTGLADGCVHLHVSRSVLEHIPGDDLSEIISEAARLLSDDGLAIHLVDFSDHFSHSDASISAVNFLRFSETEWNRLAGNRFMYQNRLRIDDFLSVLTRAGMEILDADATIDERSLALLLAGFPLDRRFAEKSAQTNATRRAWVVAKKHATTLAFASA